MFAGLPQLIKEEAPAGKESTRHYIAAAGVNERRSRARLGMLIGGGIALSLVGFLSAWTMGFIDLPIPRITNNFKFVKSAPRPTEATVFNMNPEDAPVDEVGAPGRPRSSKSKRSGRRREENMVMLEPAPVDPSRGPRGDSVETLKFDSNTNERRVDYKPDEPMLPTASPLLALPPPDQGQLSEAAIKQVIIQKRASLSLCYSEALMRKENTRGKVVFRLTVRPSGDVSNVGVITKTFRGGGIGQCIADRMRDWRFPSFAGKESTQIEVPFVLEQEF